MGIEPTVPHKVGTYGFEDRGRHQTALFFRLRYIVAEIGGFFK